MSCGDQTRHSLEVVYPKICSYVEKAVNNSWSEEMLKIDQANSILNQSETEKFKEIILRYTKENVRTAVNMK